MLILSYLEKDLGKFQYKAPATVTADDKSLELAFRASAQNLTNRAREYKPHRCRNKRDAPIGHEQKGKR